MSAIQLPELTWASDALEPAISRITIETHHGKHHRAYVNKANDLIKGTKFETMSLEEIIVEAARAPEHRVLFNNAAQVWNHSRYWESLSPNGGAPSSALAAAIDKDLGGLAKLKEDIVKKGVSHFASGWVWLALDKGKLVLVDTHDADTPLVHGQHALLVLDVWEHAYYVDYKNERERHLKTVVESVLNWRAASDKFAALAA